MANEITNKNFFTGGNAVFTVSNPAGDHYTYRISLPKTDRDGNPATDGPFFTGLLTGPDNTASYTYMGTLNPKTLVVYPTKASKLTPESKPWKVLAWALRVVGNGQAPPEGYAIQHEGKCCRCGRTLTTPKSIEIGIGPECARRSGW